jgi:DtxR family transcriptional regulator, Mn-dependent transcriptional regulator
MLSDLLNVQAPSATKMVQKLSSLGLIIYKKYGFIYLTENGREIGKFLLERHNIIETFLKNLGVMDSLLIETELIEHSVSGKTLNRIELLNQFIEKNPQFLEEFQHFCQDNITD